MLDALDDAIIQVLRYVDPADQAAILARTAAAAGGPDEAAALHARVEELRAFVWATTPRVGGI